MSGTLVAKRREDGILLDFPADEVVPFEPPEGLLEAMGIEEMVEARYAERGKDIMIRVPSPGMIRGLDPDFRNMVTSTEGIEVSGTMVTSEGEPPYDFISRFFAPWLGIDEDPVTGAAHTVLTPYWSGLLEKRVMRAHQASRRGGDLTVEMAEGGRVHLIGRSVIMFEGNLFLR